MSICSTSIIQGMTCSQAHSQLFNVSALKAGNGPGDKASMTIGWLFTLKDSACNSDIGWPLCVCVCMCVHAHVCGMHACMCAHWNRTYSMQLF